MIKALIIEDEKNTLEALKKMLQILEPSIQIVGETGAVSNAVYLIQTQQPQLIFLDIQLEDGSGFDLLEKIEDPDFKIIFTTAYNNFAIKAFKFSTIDYLLKPINPSDLQEALTKAIAQIHTETRYQELLSVLKNNINNQTPKIVVKTNNENHIIYVKDIIRLEAFGAYTIFVTQDKKITVSKNLKYYQDLLTDSFIRCHQSHLVNIQYIDHIHQNKLFLSNKEFIPIATRKINKIKEIIKNI